MNIYKGLTNFTLKTQIKIKQRRFIDVLHLMNIDTIWLWLILKHESNELQAKIQCEIMEEISGYVK